MTSLRLLAAAAFLLAASPLPVAAQSHGDDVLQIGDYATTLAVRGSEVVLHLLDARRQKVDATGFAASAEISVDGKRRRTVELKPAGENRLAGTAAFPLQGMLRATVLLRTTEGLELGRGRYSLYVMPE